MMKKMIYKIMIWLPAILMAMTIFGFSKQTGTQSDGLSQKTARVILETTNQLHITDIESKHMEEYIEAMQYPIRKTAHMTEYAILCALIYIALFVDGLGFIKRWITTLVITFLFACTDEIHQLMVPGRSGRFIDVLIDTTGCLIALLICFLIHRARMKKKVINHQ
jgi:VanZ family protein